MIVDDNDDDRFFLNLALRKANCAHDIIEFEDSASAIRHLERLADSIEPRIPLVCFLDLNMPRYSGVDVLKLIRIHKCFDIMPVIMLSTSDEWHDICGAEVAGAECYLIKHPSPERLRAIMADVAAIRSGAKSRSALAIHPANLLAKEALRYRRRG